MANESKDDAHEFADWLKEAIEEKAKISVREAGRRLATKDETSIETARGSIYKWLRADNTPNPQRRVEIGEALGVPYPRPPARTLGGRLAEVEAGLLELMAEGAEFRQEVIERLERLELRSGNEERPSTAKTAP